jgi:hypothetical protein
MAMSKHPRLKLTGELPGNEHIVFHTRHAWNMLHSTSMKQPWELALPAVHKDVLEPFRKRFKVSGSLGICNGPARDHECDNLAVKYNSFADAGLKLKKKTDEHIWEQQISFERKAAYKMWTALILEHPGAWAVSRPKPGQDLMSFLSSGIGETVKDCLGVKATGTLHNRVNPMIRFAQYAKDAGHEPFPICEHVAYQFLKNVDSAPSFPRSFITSVAFSKHVLGLMNADDILQSCRIKGFASLHYTKKRKLIQRPPLTVAQISFLEQCVNETGRTVYDRVAAGFFLVLTYGRLRFSDAMSISSMELEIPMGSEHGYLECAAERCKTGTSLEKRTRLLPVVITTKSFTEQGWIQAWLEVRHKAKLETGPGVPLLPNPASGGGWTKIPVTCEVAGDWLRALLKDVPGPANGARIATHSCKSSILSICAKYGVEPAARRLLGYHTAGRDKSMIIYSRDAMAWPIRLMEEMIDSINAKRFAPDASRSGYFPRGTDLPEDSKDAESTSSSGDSRDEEEADHSGEEAAVEKFTGSSGDTGVPENTEYFRHKTSRCLHYTADETGQLFRCGRMVTLQYTKCAGVPTFMHPSCAGCFRR